MMPNEKKRLQKLKNHQREGASAEASESEKGTPRLKDRRVVKIGRMHQECEKQDLDERHAALKADLNAAYERSQSKQTKRSIQSLKDKAQNLKLQSDGSTKDGRKHKVVEEKWRPEGVPAKYSRHC